MHAHDNPLRTDRARRDDEKSKARTDRDTTDLTALQRTVGNASVTRLLARSRGAQTEDDVQRSSVHDVLAASGRPLDGPVRREMEARLGADFSDVRVHVGQDAQRSAAEIDARAYTSGNHVVIGEGGADRHTLAHELTHVIQQRSGPVDGTNNGMDNRTGLRVSDPADRFERAAEANAARALAGPVPDAPAAQRAPAHRADQAVQRADGTRSQTGAPPAQPLLIPTRAASRSMHNEFLKHIYREFGPQRRERTGGGNFAVLYYEDTQTGRKDCEPAFNEPGQRHSEVVIIQTLQARHGTGWKPLMLFTDNSPCQGCTGEISTNMLPRLRDQANLPIYFIVGYNEPTWSMQERHTEIDRWWAQESEAPNT